MHTMTIATIKNCIWRENPVKRKHISWMYNLSPRRRNSRAKYLKNLLSKRPKNPERRLSIKEQEQKSNILTFYILYICLFPIFVSLSDLSSFSYYKRIHSFIDDWSLHQIPPHGLLYLNLGFTWKVSCTNLFPVHLVFLDIYLGNKLLIETIIPHSLVVKKNTSYAFYKD